MSIVSIISFDIIRIIGIIAIIYQSSHQHSKMAYGARDWCYNPKCTRRHDMQLLQQNIANPSPWWFMHLHFCKRPPETGAEHHTRPPPPQVHDGDATDQQIRPKVYLTDAQPDDLSDSSTGHVYPDGSRLQTW